MTGRLLQMLGAAFVLLLVGGAIAGFAVLRDRVRVVVSSESDSDTRPDPIALLRDDLRIVAQDQAALQAALASNFERLADGLEQRATVRHGDVQALVRDVAALRGEFDREARQLAELQQRLAEVAAHAAATGPVVDTPAARMPEPAAEATAASAMPVDAPRPVHPEAPPAAPAKPGFLSFTLPATQFRFDAPSDYALLPELCRVGFDAKSTLHDFTGATSQVAGSFHADFDDPNGAWTGTVRATARGLTTGVDGRDSGMWERLDSEHFAELLFTIEGFTPAEGGIDVAKQTARGSVRGTMAIRGRQRPFAMPIEVSVDPQRRVVVTGQAPLKLSDYGVPVPSQLGVINMQDEVSVWIALRARVRGEAGK